MDLSTDFSLFSILARIAQVISASYWPKLIANLRLTSLTGARHHEMSFNQPRCASISPDHRPLNNHGIKRINNNRRDIVWRLWLVSSFNAPACS